MVAPDARRAFGALLLFDVGRPTLALIPNIGWK